MASLNFPPASPGVPGNTYTENGVVYYWDGEKWTANNEDGFTDIFVDVSGDNMTGDLTFGTDKITLDATDGTAEFAGDVTFGPLQTFSTDATENDVKNNYLGFKSGVPGSVGLDEAKVGYLSDDLGGIGSPGDRFGIFNKKGNGKVCIALDSNKGGNNQLAVYDLNTGTTVTSFYNDGSASFAADAVINDVTVGRGAGNDENNTVVGRNALINNTIGEYNTAVGLEALLSNIEGQYNTGLGVSSLKFNTEGDTNTGVGQSALLNNTTGSGNTGVGTNSLHNNTEGNNNTVIGHQAGFFIGGDNNTILGGYQGTSADSSLNDTVIISAGLTERVRIDSEGVTTFNADVHVTDGDIRAFNGLIQAVYPILEENQPPGENEAKMLSMLSVRTKPQGGGDKTCSFWGGYYKDNGVAVCTAHIGTITGDANFSGPIGAPNITFNLEPDNEANYTTTTEEYTETESYTGPLGNTLEREVTKTREIRTYTGPTLDVKAVIQELQQRVNDRDAVIADLTTRIQTLEGGNN